MIDSPTVERNGRRHIYALSSIRTLQHCIFFVSNLVSILHISIVPIPFTSLFFPSTFYPLYPHIHGYIGRERKKKKKLFIFQPAKSIAIPEPSVDEVCFSTFSPLPSLLRMKASRNSYPHSSFHVTPFKSAEEEMPTQCRMTNEL